MSDAVSEIKTLQYHSPNALDWDAEGHVRSTPADPSAALIRNIDQLGRLVEPVHARRVDGGLRVFDGWRRVQACAEVGINVATLVYGELSDADALAKSLNLHTSAWNNTVSDDDRERSLMGLVTGERRTIKPWETDTGEIHEARYRLGLDSEEDRLAREIGGVEGVGPATLAALIDTFGDTESVLEADETALQAAAGVGPKTARRIREHVERDDTAVVTHVGSVERGGGE